MEAPRVLVVIPVLRNYAQYRRIPEGLLRLKKYLEKKGVLSDFAACQMDAGKIEGWTWLSENGTIRGENDTAGLGEYDLIAISITSEGITTSVTPMEKFLSELRKKAPETPFVAGGFGVWELGFQALGKYEELDIAVNRWGEVPLEFLAKQAAAHGFRHPMREKEFKAIFADHYPPRGISVKYLRKGKAAVRATGGWEEIPKEALFTRHEKKDVLEISTQLGCAYGNCAFCQWGRHTEWKQLPVDWVLQSIAEADPREARIFDACFLYKGAKKSGEILQRIKELGKNIALVYECRADAFLEDGSGLVKLMGDAGTKLAYVGFESGSERVLREFRKGSVTAKIREILAGRKVLLESNVRAIDALRDTGIGLWGYFILSSPESEATDVIKTLELMAYLAKDKARCDVSTNPAVLKTDRSGFCIGGPEEGGFKRLWPQDPLATLIARKAQAEFSRWRQSKTSRNGIEDKNGYNFTKPSPGQGEEILAVLKGLHGFIGGYLQLLERNPAKELFLGELAEKKYFGSHRDDIKGVELASERVWREYAQKGKFRAEHSKGVTFAKAAAEENERLGKVIGSKDLKEQRRILLG